MATADCISFTMWWVIGRSFGGVSGGSRGETKREGQQREGIEDKAYLVLSLSLSLCEWEKTGCLGDSAIFICSPSCFWPQRTEGSRAQIPPPLPLRYHRGHWELLSLFKKPRWWGGAWAGELWYFTCPKHYCVLVFLNQRVSTSEKWDS